MIQAGFDRYETNDSSNNPIGGILPNDRTLRLAQEAKLDGKIDVARNLIEKGSIEQANSILFEVRGFREFTLSAQLQFRIAANLGASALAMEEIDECIEQFRTAYRQQPDLPRAIVIGAIAEFFDSNYVASIGLCRKALEQEPRDIEAALTLLQALQKSGATEALEKLLADELWIIDTPICALVVAGIRFEQGRQLEALDLLEGSQKKDPGNSQINSKLGYFLLDWVNGQIANDPDWALAGDSKHTAKLQRAIEVLSLAIEAYEKHDNKNFVNARLVNRSAALGILNRNKESIDDCNTVLRYDHNNQLALVNKGSALLRLGEIEASIETLLAVPEQSWDLQVRRSLAIAYITQRSWLAALNVLEPILQMEVQKPTNSDILDIWMHTQHQVGGQSAEIAIQNLIQILLREFPNDILTMIAVAKQKFREGDKVAAIGILRKSIANSADKQGRLACITLAEMLFHSGRFRTAANIYSQYVSTSTDSYLLRHYVASLLNSGRGVPQALQIAKSMRAGNKAIPFYSEIEALIAERAGDWNETMRLLKELVKEDPLNLSHKVRIALIEFHSGNVIHARKLLQDLPSETYMSDAGLAMEVARCLILFELPGALEIAYETRRRNLNDSEVHFDYISIFQEAARDDDPILSPTEVRTGCAVELQIREEKLHRIITNDVPLVPNEVSASSPAGRDLLGCHVGDTCIAARGMLGDREGVVITVLHRYVYAYQDSMRRLGTGEISHPSLDVDKVDFQDSSEFFSRQMEMLRKRRKSGEEIRSLYQQHAFPLAFVASTQNRTLYECWSEPGLLGGQFFVSSGAPSEIMEGLEQHRITKSLVMDATAIFSIVSLDLEQQMIRRFPEILVAHATWIEIRNDYYSRKSKPDASGYMWSDGIRMYYEELPPREGQKHILFLKRVLDFIENKTKVLPVYSTVSQPRSLLKVLGNSSLSAVLLASEQGALLYCEDLRLRNLSLAEFGVRGVFCSPIFSMLMKGDGGDFSKSDLFRCLETLVLRGYVSLFIFDEFLHYILEKDGMSVTPNSRFVFARTLGGKFLHVERATFLAARIIQKVWDERLLDHKFRHILDLVLTSFLSDRSTSESMSALIRQLRASYFIDVLWGNGLIKQVQQWYDVNLHMINRGSLLEDGSVKRPSIGATLHFANPENRGYH